METGGGPKAGQSGGGAGEIEIILIDSDSDEDAGDVELSTEDVIRAIKQEPSPDAEAGLGAKEPKEPDKPEEYGTDLDTYDRDSSHYSGLGGDAKTVSDDEVDDSGGVVQHPVAMIDEEHGGG